MKTMKDLIILNIVEPVAEFKAIESLIGTEMAISLFELVATKRKNIAVQGLAMQLGLRAKKYGHQAFVSGMDILQTCKDIGLYKLEHDAEKQSVWVKPLLKFSDEELFFIETKSQENHEMPDPVVSNKGLLLSKFSQHDKPLNYLFINKINRVPFELDMDILLNFKGKNMPHNYEEVSAIHLARPIYFNWKYDSRGRSYSSGYGIDIQGNKTVRSSLSFRNKEVITDIKPLYIALANARGFDDWTWERRIEWAEKQDISYNFTIPRGTKYPEKYVKAVRAILDYREGNPSGFIMELDATASGIQIMAAITGCVKTANEVNLVDPKRRKDVYKALARNMTHQGAKTSREDVKYPCMTHFYNSLKTPRERLSVAQLEAFYKALDGLLPGAEMAMEKLNECWNPYAKSHTWVLPDGHTATFNTMTQKQGFYDYESIRLQYLYYVNEGNKESFRSLVPNIIHSIDGYIARQMVLRANFELVHVHDCFLFHPNYTEAVKSLYREILMELVTDYNINHIIESLTGRKSNIPISTDLVEHINNSSYAIS